MLCCQMLFTKPEIYKLLALRYTTDYLVVIVLAQVRTKMKVHVFLLDIGLTLHVIIGNPWLGYAVFIYNIMVLFYRMSCIAFSRRMCI